MKNNNNINYITAIAVGQKSTGPSKAFPRYTGIFMCNVVGINPTKAEIEELYKSIGQDRTVEEPVYFSHDQNGVPTARIDIWLKTLKDEVGVEILHPVSYFIKNTTRVNRDGTKLQVINAFGNTCWPTNEEQAAGIIPEKSRKFYEPEGMRPAFEGEESLTKALKAYLNIKPFSFPKDDGTTGYNEKTEAYCQLENIPRYFTGDISEIKNAFLSQPTNIIKYPFGVKKTEEGKLYQTVFKEFPMKERNNNYASAEKEIKNRQDNGGYPDTDFGEAPFPPKEYSVIPSTNQVASIAQQTPTVPVSSWYTAPVEPY